MGGLTISQAARAAGVGVETIRFYERRHLIEQPPKPIGRGFRIYPEDTVYRIRFIRRAQAAGFSLREVGELLSVLTDPAMECGHVRARARAKLDEVNRRVEQLHRIQMSLIELISACPGRGAVQECSIVRHFGEFPDGTVLEFSA